MHMIQLNAILLKLNFRMICFDIPQSLFYKLFEVTFQYPFSVLGYPYYVILMMICTVGTLSNFHGALYHIKTLPAYGWCAFIHGLTPDGLQRVF